MKRPGRPRPAERDRALPRGREPSSSPGQVWPLDHPPPRGCHGGRGVREEGWARRRRAPSCRGRSGAWPAPCSACRGGPGLVALAAADRAERSRSRQRHCRLQPTMAGEPVLLLPRATRRRSPALREKPRRRLPRGALPSARRGHCSRLPPAVTSIPAPRLRAALHPQTPGARPFLLPGRWVGAPRQPPPCCPAAVHLGRAAPALPAPSVPLLLSLLFHVYIFKPLHVLRAGDFWLGIASSPCWAEGKGHLPGAWPGRPRENGMPKVGTCGWITCPARQRHRWGFIRGGVWGGYFLCSIEIIYFF